MKLLQQGDTKPPNHVPMDALRVRADIFVEWCPWWWTCRTEKEKILGNSSVTPPEFTLIIPSYSLPPSSPIMANVSCTLISTLRIHFALWVFTIGPYPWTVGDLSVQRRWKREDLKHRMQQKLQMPPRIEHGRLPQKPNYECWASSATLSECITVT